MKNTLTYVLIHGGDRDGSVWDNVALSLRKLDQIVFCPSMKSVKEVTLKYNINEILALISKNNLNNIILVGHSYGAMVITGVLDQLFDRIACIVYVDSVIPQNGKSLYGLLADNGLNYQELGLTADPACIEPLYFSEHKITEKYKAYIHCLQSEFLAVTTPIYKNIVENSKKLNWLNFSLDAPHGCMFTHPNELAVILYGLQVHLSNKG